MIQVAVVSFIAAFALGSGAIYLIPFQTTVKAEALVDEKESPDIISPLAYTEVLGETEKVTPTPESTLSPTIKPKSSPSVILKQKIKPTPSPIPSPLPVTGAELDEWLTKYAAKESINRDLLRNIAFCESKFNQFAKNGDYLGLYQFSASTWVTTRRSMNQNPDPKLRADAEEAIKTAAFRLATKGSTAWPNCSKV